MMSSNDRKKLIQFDCKEPNNVAAIRTILKSKLSSAMTFRSIGSEMNATDQQPPSRRHYEDLDAQRSEANSPSTITKVSTGVQTTNSSFIQLGSFRNALASTAIKMVNRETQTNPIQITTVGTNIFLAPDPTHWSRANFLLICYLMIYIGYLVMGSICFQKIESPIEMKIKEQLQFTRAAFLSKYPNIEDNDLEHFLAKIIAANDRGISPLRNVSSEMNWGFGQSLFFSSTVVTTIGYGHVTPLSQFGKMFCVIYATIGIPMTLVLLTAIVDRLLVPTNWLLGKLNSKLGHLYQPLNIRMIHLGVIGTIVAIIFFIIPTAIFSYLESEWDFLDAFYYCFISLTTIGLGDYIPGEGVQPDNRSLYKICITIYLILGLVGMMLTLTIFYEIPQLNLGQLFTENPNCESEKLRLSGNSAPCYSGPSGLYIPQRDEDMRRIRVRPHADESPSPDEQPATPTMGGRLTTNPRDIRVP